MCLFPTRAQTQEIGRPKPNPEGDLVLPCGKCTECISKRALEWSLRARHEISCHSENCFLTLTYNNENLPSIFLVKDEFQKFIKNLRYHIKQPIRYMVSHEYGSKTFRPHHHAIIFGWNPDNQQLLKTTPSGQKLFTSSALEKLWTLGFSSIGTANERTAYYIASYSLKGKTHSLTDPKTGELVSVSDCMDVSKRPAIGYEYFKQNQLQLVNSGEILPRYYLKKLEKENPELLAQYQNNQSLSLKTRSSHELYSKFIISEQKKTHSSEFRPAPDNFEEKYHAEKQLINNRDEYHRKTCKDEK